MADMPGMRVDVAFDVPPLRRPGVNLLTADQASLETSAGGWFYWRAGDPNLLERSADFASDGAWSLKLTSTPGDPSFWFTDARLTDPGQVVVWDYGSGPLQTGFVVTPGETYTATADFRAADGTVGHAFLSLVFYETVPNGAFTFTDGPWQLVDDRGWTQVQTIAQAPAGAGWATMRLVTAGDAGPVYADRIGLLSGGAGWVPPGVDPWSRIDETPDPAHASPLRHLSVTRGARMRVAEIETGEATARFDNRNRALDPANAASPWAPNVKPRRRIRYTAETSAGDVPVFTGFVDRLPPGWDLGDGWVDLSAVDLLALIGSDTLTHSMFEREVLGALRPPAHWWRLDESSGRVVRDEIGTTHGAWSADLSGQDPLLPFEGGRGNETFGSEEGKAWQPGQIGKVVTVPGFTGAGFPFQIDGWVRLTRPPVPINAGSNLWLNARLFHRLSTSGPTQELSVYVRWDNDPGLHGRPYLRWTRSSGAPFELATWPVEDHPSIADGNLHHIRVRVDVDPSTLEPHVAVWVDGTGIAYGTGLVDAGGSSTWPGTPDFASTLTLGVHNYASVVGFAGAGILGHVTYAEAFDRDVPDPSPQSLIDAALHAGRGDLTGARIERVLDIVGVDPTDRDIDPGTEVCGPAIWKGAGVLDYLRRVVATEQGALFVSPAGRITFRGRTPNDPTATVRLAGKPDDLDPAVVPYSDISPVYDLGRLVNVAEVSSDSQAQAVRVEHPGSVTEFGPIASSIDTAADQPSQLRSIGQRLISRHHAPRTVLDRVDLASRRDDVPPAVSLGVELGAAVEVVASPPGPGGDLEQLSLVERIEQTFDWVNLDHRTSFGVAEVVTLPTLRWDTPGRGWDASVWPQEP